MALIQKRECDICRKEIKDDTRAGLFTANPPLTQELRDLKANPEKVAEMAGDPSSLMKAMKAVHDHEKSITRYELCAECTGFVEGAITNMTELSKQVNDNTITRQ